ERFCRVPDRIGPGALRGLWRIKEKTDEEGFPEPCLEGRGPGPHRVRTARGIHLARGRSRDHECRRWCEQRVQRHRPEGSTNSPGGRIVKQDRVPGHASRLPLNSSTGFKEN